MKCLISVLVTFCVTLIFSPATSAIRGIYNDVASKVDSLNSTRNGKFIWGIGVVKFQNTECAAIDGAVGTCYTRRECHEIGGMGSGHCAANIGTCCVGNSINIFFYCVHREEQCLQEYLHQCAKTCGGSSSLNNTYFVNPNFPSTFNGGSTCTFTIKKCHPEICQVRIDFLNFNLAQPNGNGTCVTDSFNVFGGASSVPPICGENSGSHIYVDFNGNDDIRLLLQTGQQLGLARNWRFKISQIDCECPTRAPTGCLQYYTSTAGTVMSFNYGQTVSSAVNGSRQLANNNYGICVAMQPGFCSITWSQVAGDPYSFTVSNDTNMATANSTVGTPAAYINGTNCTTDFVVIPNAYVNGVPANTDRFCGNAIPPVTTSSKPFVLTVVTNGDEINDPGNRGFNLMYTQNRCSNFMMALFT